LPERIEVLGACERFVEGIDEACVVRHDPGSPKDGRFIEVARLRAVPAATELFDQELVTKNRPAGGQRCRAYATRNVHATCAHRREPGLCRGRLRGFAVGQPQIAMQTDTPQLDIGCEGEERPPCCPGVLHGEEDVPGAEGGIEAPVSPSDHAVEITLRNPEYGSLFDSLFPAPATPRQRPRVRKELSRCVVGCRRSSMPVQSRQPTCRERKYPDAM
jgi:hypothetical protein